MMPETSKAGPTNPAGSEAGYTYPAVLILMVAAGIAISATTIPSNDDIIRDQEAELLFRGTAYRDAIASYREMGAAGGAALPLNMRDLLSDPRADGVRHIRRLYDDPMPGGGWRILHDVGGGIVGVASTAPGTPRRKAFFPSSFEGFSEARSYADWRFVVDLGDG